MYFGNLLPAPPPSLNRFFPEPWVRYRALAVPGRFEKYQAWAKKMRKFKGTVVTGGSQLHCLHITGSELDCYRLSTAPPCHPSHKELHCMVGSVSYALVRWVGMSLMLGGGPTPRPPILCIFMYLYKYTLIILCYQGVSSKNPGLPSKNGKVPQK